MKHTKKGFTLKETIFYLLLAAVIFVITIYVFQGIINFTKGRLDSYNCKQLNDLLKESSRQSSYDSYEDLLDLLTNSNAIDEDRRLTLKAERQDYYFLWNQKYNEVTCEKYDDIITIDDGIENSWLDENQVNKVLVNRQGILFDTYYLIYTKYDVDPLKSIKNDEICDNYFVNYSKITKLYKKLLDCYYKNENIYLCDFNGSNIIWYVKDNDTIKLVKNNVKNEKIDNVIVLDGVKYIPNNAFDEYESIKKIHLPKSIEKIGNNAFKNCKDLEIVYYINEEFNLKFYRELLN